MVETQMPQPPAVDRPPTQPAQRAADRVRDRGIRRCRFAGVLVAGILCVSSIRADQYPTAAETRAEFESVCRRFVESDDPFFGRAAAERLEQRLAEGTVDPLSEVLVRGRLSGELVRLGEHQRAIDSLERVLTLLEDPQLDPDGKIRTRVYQELGTAHLQLGEEQNCLEDHSARSCILPIAPEAVHSRPQAVRAAGDYYLKWLERQPDDLTARWLLNLSRMISGDYPQGVPTTQRLPKTASTTAFSSAWKDISTTVGIAGVDLAGGAVADDFDGDGLIDLISSSWHPCEPLRAYRNRGDGSFEPVAAAWGLDGQLGALNLNHTDFDNDGDLDLLVLRGAWLGSSGRIRNSLLRNDLDQDGARRFVDVTAAAGLAFPSYPTQNAAWIDLEPDGDLDVFIGNEATGISANPLQLFGNEGNPYPSQLFRNNGNGTFTDIARAAGLDNRRFTKGSAWGDYDDDGDPDLYLSNIGPNRLYRNNGDGSFTDVAPELGVSRPQDGSFATWFFDFDNDGDEDLFVASYSAEVETVFAAYLGLEAPKEGRPILYRNDGGRFTDISADIGLDRPLLIMGANYGDVDSDGFLDLYLGTGIPDFEAIMPNVFYRNQDGRALVDATAEIGLGHLQKGHGVAFADFDNDGYEDIYQQLGGAFPYDAYSNTLYRNPGNDHRWLSLELEGTSANRRAVGARVEVRLQTGVGGRRSVFRTVGTGGSFGSSSLQLELGLGAATAIEAVTVRWPGQTEPQKFEGFELDTAYRLRQGSPQPIVIERIRVPIEPTQKPQETRPHHES